MDNVQQMAEIYIDKLQNTLWDWMENIVRANTELADERVSENAKGKFSTPAPVDLFNLINETMIMAKSSGVEELEAAALSSCLNVLADFLTDIMEDMKETKKQSFEYVVASANDCSAIIDNLDTLEEENSIIIEKHLRSSDFETLREKYSDALMQCISFIADMIVVDDLADVIRERVECKGRFDPADSASVVSGALERIIATIEDYFSDLRVRLHSAYFLKMTKACIEKFVLQTCSQLGASYRKSAKGAMFAADAVKLRIGPRGFENDVETLLDSLANYVRDRKMAVKYYAKVLLPLDNLNDIFTCAPAMVPHVLHRLLESEPKSVARSVQATVAMCVNIRQHNDTISSQEKDEIEVACKGVFAELVPDIGTPLRRGHKRMGSSVPPPPPLTQEEQNNPFVCATPLKYGIRSRHDSGGAFSAGLKSMIARFTPSKKPKGTGHTRAQSAGIFTDASKGLVTVNMMEHQATPRIPVVDTALSGSRNDDSKADSHDVTHRRPTLVAPTPDLSIDASHERRRLRRESISPGIPRRLSLSPMNALAGKIANEPLTAELTGYLMKQNPQKKWQKRWFALRTVMYAHGSRREWRSALVWHKDSKSSVNSQLYIDEIVGQVTFVKSPPGHFDASNTFIFEKGAGVSGGSKRICSSSLYEVSKQTMNERTCFKLQQ